MITNFNEFKQKMNENKIPDKQIEKICELALNCRLSRFQTNLLVEKVFTDPAKAPEEISVKFVKNNIKAIKSELAVYYESMFGYEYNFNSKILESKNPFELIVSIEKDKVTNVIKLFESLNKNIQKEEFHTFSAYNEDGPSYFYISNLSVLNEHNKNIVLKTLELADAINISTQLKWARTIV